ncbi:MAG: TetR family transcriptional regulator [Actinophytocola sp.]|nr:TetR family transcriptional regulator [Actinophytocola sp.]
MTDAVHAGRERAAHLGPERRRPQVLDAALAIAVESGVGAVTIGAVADRLGVTRPVVYSCFRDRVALIAALVEREADRLLASALAALHSARGDDPEAVFVRGYRAFLDVVADWPDAWRLLFSAAPDPAVADQFQRARLVMADSATRWLRPALTAWWDVADLERKLPVLVELFMSSCEAAARSLLDHPDDWTTQELGELYGRMICRAVSVA